MDGTPGPRPTTPQIDPQVAPASAAPPTEPAASQSCPRVGSTVAAFFVMIAVGALACAVTAILVVLGLMVTGTAADDLERTFEQNPALAMILGVGFQAAFIGVALAWRPRNAAPAVLRLGLVNPGFSAS